MNKEDMRLRKIAIENEMQQYKNNYAKLEGHLAECNHWLAQMEAAENAMVPQDEEQQHEPVEKEPCDGEANNENACEAT